MNFVEILPLLFVNLQSLYRKNVRLKGYTFPQIIALYIIPSDGIEMSNLSNKLGIDLSTLSRLINGLENKKVVKRVKSKLDKRIIKIFLDSKSIELKRIIEEQFDDIGYIIDKKIDSKNLNLYEEILSELNWEISKVLLDK